MANWTKDELGKIDAEEMLDLSAASPDGSLPKAVDIWAVRAGDKLYVWSYNGTSGRWYQSAKASRKGRVSSGGATKDVMFELIEDAATNDAVDEAYRAKYSSSPYLAPMINDRARAATVELVSED